MKYSPLLTFFLGLTVGVLLSFGAKIISHSSSARLPAVPNWSRVKALQEGVLPLEGAVRILDRQDIGVAIEECQDDYARANRGSMRLVSVYEKPGGDLVIVVFNCNRDEVGRDVRDRAIAYVYSRISRTLIGRFWVPKA